jgi:hypothetical protein
MSVMNRAVFGSAGVVAFVTAFLAFLVYARSMYPGVGPIDSGELAWTAWTGGVAHAPGFPLYTALGWAWAHAMAIGTVAWRLNFLSALAGAVTVGLVAWVGARLAERMGAPRSWACVVGGAAAIAYGAGWTAWRSSIVTEVYAVNTAIVAVAVAIALLARSSHRAIACVGVVFGLGLAVHPVSTLFVAPLLLAWAWPMRKEFPIARLRWREVGRRAAIGIGVAFVVVVLAYGAMLLRARQDPAINWGNPSTVERLWWHMTGRQYQVNLTTTPLHRRAELLGASLQLWAHELTPIGLALGAWGWIILARRDRRWGWGIAGSVLLTLAYTASYDIANDREAYHLPLLLLTALGIATGIHDCARRCGRRYSVIRVIVPVCAVVLALTLPWLRWATVDRSRDTISGDYARNAMMGVSSRAVVLVADWQLVSPFWYAQGVEGLRPDVTVIDLALWQNRPWYVEQFARRHVDLARPWQSSLDAFLPELRAFERDELRDTSRIGAAYRALLGAMVRATGHPVYADAVAFAHLQQFGAVDGMRVIPHGILFQIVPATVQPIGLPKFTWTLAPFRTHRVVLDSVEREIRDRYIVMLGNRTRYLMSVGDPSGARAAEELARELGAR